jgi:hypothetical protein
MVMQDPYNKPAKDKVTLSFANCYDKPKVSWTGTRNPAKNPVQTLENEVDRLKAQVKDFAMTLGNNRPKPIGLTLGE